jgi:serine/threonine-protein phosphatase 2B catalytic subunit
VTERVDVAAPTAKIPTDDEFFSKKRPGFPDIAHLKAHFHAEGVLDERHALHILTMATELLRKETTVLDVEAPVTGSLLFDIYRIFFA